MSERKLPEGARAQLEEYERFREELESYDWSSRKSLEAQVKQLKAENKFLKGLIEDSLNADEEEQNHE